jgi:hypothetical protein
MVKIKEILKTFEEKGIDYCVLRSYEDFSKSNEIDILINDSKKIKKILPKLGFKKGTEYGYYLTFKDNDLRLDFKVKFLAYEGFRYEDSRKLLEGKRKYRGFFVLSQKDELIHLILHSIIDKGYFKEEYKYKITRLLNKINSVKVMNELVNKFGNSGNDLFYLIRRGEYKKSLKLKKPLCSRLLNVKDFIIFFTIKVVIMVGKIKYLFLKRK